MLGDLGTQVPAPGPCLQPRRTVLKPRSAPGAHREGYEQLHGLGLIHGQQGRASTEVLWLHCPAAAPMGGHGQRQNPSHQCLRILSFLLGPGPLPGTSGTQPDPPPAHCIPQRAQQQGRQQGSAGARGAAEKLPCQLSARVWQTQPAQGCLFWLGATWGWHYIKPGGAWQVLVGGDGVLAVMLGAGPWLLFHLGPLRCQPGGCQHGDLIPHIPPSVLALPWLLATWLLLQAVCCPADRAHGDPFRILRVFSGPSPFPPSPRAVACWGCRSLLCGQESVGGMKPDLAPGPCVSNHPVPLPLQPGTQG